MIGFNNGVFVELSQISIPVTSISINRGYGAFEFFEVIRQTPFYGDRHFNRFFRSLELLKLRIRFSNELPLLVEELISKNKLDSFYIKLFALPHGAAVNGWYDAALYIFPTEMPAYDPSLYQEGAHLVTRNFQRFLPEAKSTNYLAGQFWLDEQDSKQVVDVLYHNGKTVQETSRGNIFVVKGGKVITPAKAVLKGVTRGMVLEILKSQNLAYAETELSLNVLMSADEVFLSSTTKHILPITKIDDQIIGIGKPGKITERILTEFERLRKSF